MTWKKLLTRSNIIMWKFTWSWLFWIKKDEILLDRNRVLFHSCTGRTDRNPFLYYWSMWRCDEMQRCGCGDVGTSQYFWVTMRTCSQAVRTVFRTEGEFVWFIEIHFEFVKIIGLNFYNVYISIKNRYNFMLRHFCMLLHIFMLLHIIMLLRI